MNDTDRRPPRIFRAEGGFVVYDLRYRKDLRIMTGREAVEYIESIEWMGTRLGLERTEYMLEKLGNPEKTLRFVHIAGTNGKGSTAALIASVMREAGYVTGLYISPFLQKFNERMQVNGEMIPDADLGRITQTVKDIADSMDEKPTEFEIITCVAFVWFLEKKCDIVVLETGLGGRLDATNAIPAPLAAVICNIGLDHTAILGDTTVKIAGEKAGIIKSGSRVVLYQQSEDAVTEVFRKKCAEVGDRLDIADFSKIRVIRDDVSGQLFDCGEWKNVEIRLLGGHQRKNAAVALETVKAMRESGMRISDAAVYGGLAKAEWPGRFELLHRSPDFIADGGHNLQCVGSFVSALDEYFPGRRATMIIGVLADKNYSEMMDLLAPYAERFITVTPDSTRALSAEKLGKLVEKYGKPVDVRGDVKSAVDAAFGAAGNDGLICSVGSLYMTGEIRSRVLERK